MNVRLNLPEYHIRTRVFGGRDQVWDQIRKKWLVLTPEEWVRQNFIRYLTGPLGYHPMLIRQEQAVRFNGVSGRADITVHDTTGRAVMIVECKAPEVKLTSEVLEQAMRYNFSLEIGCIGITNGLNHYFFSREGDGSLRPIREIPAFSELVGR